MLIKYNLPQFNYQTQSTKYVIPSTDPLLKLIKVVCTNENEIASCLTYYTIVQNR